MPPTRRASGKKRRPKFRPASQRKSATKDAAAFVTPQEPTTSVPVVPPTELVSETVGQQKEAMEETALVISTTASRRSSKKRKATTGVAIGASRQESELEETVTEEEPAVLSEPQVPDAAPGQLILKTFCSKYRTKEKRKTTQKTTKAPAQPQASNAPAEQTTASAGPVVQVVDGEIVLQESSVVVPGARRSVQEVEEEYEQVVEEEQQHSAVIGASYNSFVSRRAPQHWTIAETKLFYTALRQVGPDFCTMAAYFDNRTRKQLKKKYQIEMTKNPHLIELALSPQAKIPLDMSVFNVGSTTTQADPDSVTATAATNEISQSTSQAGDQVSGEGVNETAVVAVGAQEEEKQDDEAAAASQSQEKVQADGLLEESPVVEGFQPEVQEAEAACAPPRKNRASTKPRRPKAKGPPKFKASHSKRVVDKK